jgi:hypothetical protein
MNINKFPDSLSSVRKLKKKNSIETIIIDGRYLVIIFIVIIGIT